MNFRVYDLEHCPSCNSYLVGGDDYFMAKFSDENGWHRLHFCDAECYGEFIDMYDHLEVIEQGYRN